MKKYIDYIYSTNKFADFKEDIEKSLIAYLFYTDYQLFETIRKDQPGNLAFFEFAVQNSMIDLIHEYAQQRLGQHDVARLFEIAISGNLFDSFLALARYHNIPEDALLYIVISNIKNKLTDTLEVLLEMYADRFINNYADFFNTNNLYSILDLYRISKNLEAVAKLQQYQQEQDMHPLLVRPFKKFEFFQPGILIWGNF